MAWKARPPDVQAPPLAIPFPPERLEPLPLAWARSRARQPVPGFVRVVRVVRVAKVVQWVSGVPGAALLFRIRWRPGLVHP